MDFFDEVDYNMIAITFAQLLEIAAVKYYHEHFASCYIQQDVLHP